MKPLLVIGLGSTLMGDDGVGARVAELLAADPVVTRRADVVSAGTDVLRSMDQIEGRRRVVLIDAMESDGPPGAVSVVEDLRDDSGPEYAHTLSAARAIELMRSVMPSLESTRFTWVLVGVRSADARPELSAAVAAAVPRVIELVKQMK